MKTHRSVNLTSIVILLFVMGLYFLPLVVVSAQETNPSEPTDDQVNAVAKQLYCVVCDNTPLDVCPTQACIKWRALIREQLSQGWTESEIKDYFAVQHGDRVLAFPPPRGINLLVYVIPPLAIIGGGYILFRAMRSWRQTSPQGDGQSLSGDSSDDEYIARIEEELRRR